ncbi:MAG: hypothetical protein ACAI44_03905 [Candidatus Sericytochromatia bacterium]
MSYRLDIDWHGASDRVLEPSARLFTFDQHVPGPPLQADYAQNRFSIENLSPECYLLSLRYVLDGKHFDSCYFQLDLPDITQLKLELRPEGCQIDQMGFVNAAGEFVDMLIYTDEKPWLARAVEDFPYLQILAEFLVFRFQHLAPTEARSQLNQLLGSLDQVFPELAHLWPYQLKMLIQPQYLAQTTPEWKACLIHLLRNDLILIDDESLYENLQEAVALAQQEEAVAHLTDELEWNPTQQSEAFLKALAGKRMLGS